MLNITIITLYEIGHQSFGAASAGAWLRQAGARVSYQDLSVQALDEAEIQAADLVALHLPMHTATRIGAAILPRLRQLNPAAHICCFGLYAPINEGYLRELGVQTILGGEFEEGLLALCQRLSSDSQLPVQATQSQSEPTISRNRQHFITPDRTGFPALTQYAAVELNDQTRRTAGYTEASRGCKHLCRHCPITPIYNGTFRVVQKEVVLADIRNQAAAGAQHITFGDPDFFNGPGHALSIVQALHAEFPNVTYDVTIKVEHLLQQRRHLPTLAATGCLFVTSAVEAVDDAILARLDKGHTAADFEEAVHLLRAAGLHMSPTFVAFTPWITPAGYMDFLRTIAQLELIEHIAPIQYAIRLLIPAGSRLLELAEVQALVGEFDEAALVYPWRHPDPCMDELQEAVLKIVQQGDERGLKRAEIFAQVWQLAAQFTGLSSAEKEEGYAKLPPISLHSKPAPRLLENWYC
ncbi:MAG: CUAEP/CCAEP-tail radical SAM protein [Caldilineaceae bacterium]